MCGATGMSAYNSGHMQCKTACLLYPPKRTSKSCVDHPGSNACWVSAKDELSLSLLQVRLIDLRMPIKIVQGV